MLLSARLKLIFALFVLSALYLFYTYSWDIYDALPPNLIEAWKRHPVLAKGTELRIMPVGDSITQGVTLPPGGNAYRRYLAQNLARSYARFVGTQHAGDMHNNAHEAYPGFTIEMAFNTTRGRHALEALPNVVLLHMGTNDLTGQFGAVPDATPAGLATVLDYLLAAPSNPVVLVAQVVRAWNATLDAKIGWYNMRVAETVQARAERGERVLLVDMQSVRGRLLWDGIHPNRGGFQRMADRWFAGLQDADRRGWIREPIAPFDGELKPWGGLRGWNG